MLSFFARWSYWLKEDMIDVLLDGIDQVVVIKE